MIEQGLIGVLLIDNSKYDLIADKITPEDFETVEGRDCFEIIKKLDGKCDAIVLGKRLNEAGKKYSEWYTEGMNVCNTNAYEQYVSEIKEESKKRQLKKIGKEIETGTATSKETISEVENKLLKLYDNHDKKFRHAHEISVDWMTRLVEIESRGLAISGLTTGLRCLDLVSDGMKSGELIIIGARPSNGKTSLMIHIADHVGVELKKRVCIFSIECPETEIWNKFVSRRARIPTKKLRIGKLDESEKVIVGHSIDILADTQIHVNDVSSINSFGIRANIRRMIADNKKPDLVMIDYLGLIATENSRENFAKRLGDVTKMLKALAKDLEIPVVVLVQINRSASEDGGLPKLHQLKDSGEIEQDADQVWLLHREEFYKREKTPDDKVGKMDIIVAKNRNGATLDLEVNWDGENTRIYE